MKQANMKAINEDISEARRKAKLLIKLHGHEKALSLAEAMLKTSQFYEKMKLTRVIVFIKEIMRENNFWELNDMIKECEE